MFQRTLLRQGQAARSALSFRTFSTAPSAIRRPSQLQPQLSQIARPLIHQPAFRCYSTEKEASEKAETTEGEASAESQATEDPVLKELEDKKKEAAEMKVGHAWQIYGWQYVLRI